MHWSTVHYMQGSRLRLLHQGQVQNYGFIDLQCPAGTDPNPDDEEDEDKDEEVKNQKCGLQSDPDQPDESPDSDGDDSPEGGGSPTNSGGGSPTNSPGSTTRPGSGGSPTNSADGSTQSGGGWFPTKTASPTADLTLSPDFSSPSTNVNKCCDSGQMATRKHMVQAAESFCKTYDGVTFGSNSFQAAIVGIGWQEVHKSGLNILVRLEAKNTAAGR
jgi:hypothetical protein